MQIDLEVVVSVFSVRVKGGVGGGYGDTLYNSYSQANYYCTEIPYV